MIAKDKWGLNVDLADIIGISYWLGVLSAPPLYRTLQRPVDPAHVARLLDTWIAYVERDDRYWNSRSPPVPREDRPALAHKLRELVAAWTPPELPAEITEAARALLHAEGLKSPQGSGWDDLTFDLGEEPVEDILIWPEGIPRHLKRAAR